MADDFRRHQRAEVRAICRSRRSADIEPRLPATSPEDASLLVGFDLQGRPGARTRAVDHGFGDRYQLAAATAQAARTGCSCPRCRQPLGLATITTVGISASRKSCNYRLHQRDRAEIDRRDERTPDEGQAQAISTSNSAVIKCPTSSGRCLPFSRQFRAGNAAYLDRRKTQCARSTSMIRAGEIQQAKGDAEQAHLPTLSPVSRGACRRPGRRANSRIKRPPVPRLLRDRGQHQLCRSGHQAIAANLRPWLIMMTLISPR